MISPVTLLTQTLVQGMITRDALWGVQKMRITPRRILQSQPSRLCTPRFQHKWIVHLLPSVHRHQTHQVTGSPMRHSLPPARV